MKEWVNAAKHGIILLPPPLLGQMIVHLGNPISKVRQ